MKWMAEQGFDVVEYVKVDNKSIFEAIDNYAERVHSFEIPSDGLVLTLEDLEYAATLGTTANFRVILWLSSGQISKRRQFSVKSNGAHRELGC